MSSDFEQSLRNRILEWMAASGTNLTEEEFEQKVKEVKEDFKTQTRRAAQQLEAPRPNNNQQSLEDFKTRSQITTQNRAAQVPIQRAESEVIGDLHGTKIGIETGATKELIGATSDAGMRVLGAPYSDIQAATNQNTLDLNTQNLEYLKSRDNMIGQQLSADREARTRGMNMNFLKDLALTGYLIFGD